MLLTNDNLPQSVQTVEHCMWEALSQLDSDESTAPIWQPSPENAPQCMAYELAKSGKVMQMGYGGEPHGGKTDLILGLAGTVFPDAKIFRRIFRALTKVIKRGNDIYPTRYVAGDKKYWEWPGHFIELAHMQYEKHWQDHQGQPSAFMAFDEAAQFTETMIRTVGGWLRSTDEGQHTLLLLAFNPPTTPEGEWIVQFFAPWIAPDYPGERANDGEIRWFVYIDDKDVEVPNGDPITTDNGLTLYPVSRTFISASRHSNPYHTVEYEQALSALPEPLRTMMMNADYTLTAIDDKWQVFPTNWLLAAQKRHRDGVKPQIGLRAVGVDVAHGGKAKTAIAKLYANWFDELVVYPGEETPDGEIAAMLVIQAMETIGAPVAVDSIGYGTHCSYVLEHTPGMKAYAVNVGVGSSETDKSGVYHFANLKAQIFWQLREALNPKSDEDIALPDSRDLRVEMAAMRYKIQGGKIKIELKEDTTKRLGHSPDLADAVALAWYACSRSEATWGDYPDSITFRR